MSVNILQEGDLVSITGWPGHQILNSQGNAFPQRNKIQFRNSTIRDDITNNTTVITPQGGGSGSDPATPDDLGVVKPDNITITVDQTGTISAVPPSVATDAAAGIVKPDGTTITIEQDGTLHGASSTPIATDQTVGTVKPDGTTITIDQNGTISAIGGSATEFYSQSHVIDINNWSGDYDMASLNIAKTGYTPIAIAAIRPEDPYRGDIICLGADLIGDTVTIYFISLINKIYAHAAASSQTVPGFSQQTYSLISFYIKILYIKNN